MIHEARYYNADGKGIAIVASVTPNIDWAAYIGADNGWSEDTCVSRAKDYGAKLGEKDARYYFPEFKDLLYRA
jgi:hypothetical protein